MGFLKGKTAIITGGGKALLKDGSPGSIGYGVALAYAKEGANLVITGRNVEKLENAKKDLEENYGIEVLALPADVSAGNDNEGVVKNVIDKTIEKFSRIDVLINIAQASASGVPLGDHTTENFDLAIYSGLYGTFYFMKYAYPHLKESKGTVINFASGAGLFGNYGQGSYAAAKEGIRGLSRVAATEWAPDGINVNVICPLAFTKALEDFKDHYPQAYEKNVKIPPVGYLGRSEPDIGRVCVQLASEDFKYLTGETLTLEGGLGLRP
ncbi:MAG: SDR family NAD(P)-dependent oxidoreductase [Tissierellia bacterium]|nr:SDR family NAD(P)-dependent oxidoreductase [Tissierellia bacterium]